MEPYLKRAWAEVSLARLEKNAEVIKSLCPGSTEVMAVVKADAYGHGDRRVCECLYEKCGIKNFAVSNLDEAVAVREFCPAAEILILGYTPPEYAGEIAAHNIIQGIVSEEYARELAAASREKIRCHVKIDTGMGRIGLKYDTPAECADAVLKLCGFEKLRVEGIFTHFAAADSSDPDDIAYTDAQEKFILDTYRCLAERGVKLRHVHYLNSAALCTRSTVNSTLARAGIILYGLLPDISMTLPDGTEHVMELKAVVSHVKSIKKGDCVSYGRTFRAERPMKIATVAIGYADGYSRLLSSKGEILVRGRRCAVVGRVCMDQLMIDVTGKDACPGDIATLIGRDGDEIVTADELASLYGTIGYEVVCGITKRVPRIYLD